MRFLVLCDVTQCTAMSCVVLSCDELSSVVKWCGAMGWDLMSLWCDVAGCDVTLCGSKSLCGVNWKMIWWSVLHRSTPYYTVLQSTSPVLLCTTQCYSSTTLYYKVLLQYYSVLQSTIQVVLCTTIVLQSTTPVLLCTTKYYSGTTPYYKVLLQYYSVLHSTTPVLQSTAPVLFCTTKYYSSTTPYYTVLLQYYSSTTLYYSSTTKYYSSTIPYYTVLPVLQGTAPVLFCTTKYYSSTTPYYTVLLQYYSSTTLYYSSTTKYYSSTFLYYKLLLQHYSVLHTPVLLRTTQYYKVLLQYYSVLHSATPVLLCTTKYYSSTFLYYKVLLQYYSVLQSTIPVVLCTTKYYSSTTPVLLRTTQYYSSTTPYYKVLLQYYSVLQSTTPVLFCTTKCYSSTTLYYRVLLRYYSLYYKVLIRKARSTNVTNVTKCCACHAKWLILVTYEKWNLIYNAQSNRTHPPTSPNTAPATQNDSHEWCPSHTKRHLQCAEQQVSYTKITKCCACHEEWLASLILVTFEMSFTMRGATGLILQRHQILCLPRKMTRIIDPPDIWNVIYNARSNRCHPPTSPSTVPATKNDSHHWSSWHMKRHLQCAEQQASPCNLTKYCACHEKWLASLLLVTYETSFTTRGATGITLQPHQILRLPRKIALQNLRKICRKQLKRHFQCAADSTMIRTWSEWSEHDPTMKLQNWTRPFAERTFPPSATHFVLNITTFRAPAIYPDFTEYCACHEKWQTPKSPNTAPATQNGSHDWCPSHMKRHLQCAEQQVSSSNVTKYCTCHAKWLSWLMPVTYDTSFTMRGATGITLQPHQILRLPRIMTRMSDPRDTWNVIYNARSNRHHPPTSPHTAPATQDCIPKSKRDCPKTVEVSFTMRDRFEHDPSMNSSSRTRPFAEATFCASATHFVLKITTFRVPAIYPNFTKYCACHEKWNSNITKCCACHEKWHSKITKYCPCHEK